MLIEDFMMRETQKLITEEQKKVKTSSAVNSWSKKEVKSDKVLCKAVFVEDSARIMAELDDLDDLEDMEMNGTQLRFLYAQPPIGVQKKPDQVPILPLYGSLPEVQSTTTKIVEMKPEVVVETKPAVVEKAALVVE